MPMNRRSTNGRIELTNWIAATLFFALAMAFSAPIARCQVLYGSLTGTVTDATGAVIPDVSVTLTNQGTKDSRTTTTNSSGLYLAQNLLPGTYTVSVPAQKSFGGFSEKDVTVEVNREVRLDVVLKTGNVEITTTVTDTQPMMQTESAEVNHEISQTEISELPITSSQGRNFQALYTLLPGAAPPYEENSTASNPSRAMSTNVNGIAHVSNTTRIDGAINTYGWLPYIIAYVPPADAIQSVNVVTNSFNAEQGVAGGASINVTVKSGTSSLHGSAWEYNQLFNTNARSYTQTAASFARVPKNIFNQFGFSIGGPVYLPKLLTGNKKLFFFQDFERTTRRQLITGQQTVPDTNMLGGNFNEVASITTLYDPQPGGVAATGPNQVNGYLLPGFRPTFASEYPTTGNSIPTSRQSAAAQKMLALLAPISAQVGTPSAAALTAQLANDYNGSGTLSYNRNSTDTKITYIPTDRTTIFGRYSADPFAVDDPQELGAAGGGTFDGGQAGAAAGLIQNIGLGASHIITSNLVIDTDFGFTRQRTGAQSAIDIADGDFGLTALGIPGTNGIGPNYVGQPIFAMSGGTSFSSLGNTNTGNPFLFRDNQYTGDVNVSWTKHSHAMKYGAEYYHFALNHFQPSAGSGVNNPRGGFVFQGGMTANSTSGFTDYNSLADFLLGLPNSGAAPSVAKTSQLSNPNSVRWSAFAFYAQDQWTITSKLTLNYGARYEYYPPPTRDHEGIFRFDPSLPFSANVVLGGINGNPNNAGLEVGKGLVAPRLGIAYRVNDRMVIRSGAGITEDPDNFRFFRDTYPEDNIQNYNSPATGEIATSTGGITGTPLPLTVGIPSAAYPNLSSGFVSKPVTTSTTTAPKNFRRGYIESWNLFVQQDLGAKFVSNIGYVGTHEVRQISSIDINPAPLPSGNTVCMANGQYNPSSPYYTSAGATSNNCSFAANEIWNVAQCNASSVGGATCYDTAGPGTEAPTFSAEYNALQAQLTRMAGRLAQFGIVYTWSHAIDFADNSINNGPSFAYPAYFSLNRATSGYDHTHDFQFWWIYHLPFGHDQMFANHGMLSAILGGFQLNGQLSHYSGEPFSVTASNTVNSAGNTLYANLVAPYHQIGGHNRTPGNTAVSGGKAFFDPTSFANPTEPTYTSTQLPSSIVAPNFGNTHRNEFRGPGQTLLNASVFRSFHLYRESDFQVRVEAFNALNHATISICGFPQGSTGNVCSVADNSGTLGYITNFGAARTLQFSGRISF
jgi:hypothetical protein